ncbi:hypothetical protein V6Z12_D04G128800 [Gossypium hirsutum]
MGIEQRLKHPIMPGFTKPRLLQCFSSSER